MEFAERCVAKIPTASKTGGRPKLTGTKQGLREGGTGGTQGARKSSDVSASSFGVRTQKRISLSGNPPFFCSSPNFGQNIRLNLSEDLFFALHQILGKISD